jgi:2-oxoisovalerate ferredoxin oxidoreductase beta subunit
VGSYTVVQQKAKSFYPLYERKSELQHQTHYCPGCGHGIAHKLVARAIDELGLQDRTILVSPVGCSVFAYHYFDVGNVQAAHGRAPAVATALKRSRPDSIVIGYQGDGDLAAIGSAEMLHAANRGEPITVFFLNNGIYGMTGGQMAPTTLIGQKTTTTPFGRTAWNEGYPLHVCELLATLEAPVYLARVALGNAKQVIAAGRAVRQAIANQVEGLGFSLVEILSPCPTIWGMTPVDAQRWVREDLVKVYPPGVYRDRTKTAKPRSAPPTPPPLEDIPRILGLEEGSMTAEPIPSHVKTDWRIKIAGFGGQGVLMLGELLAEAGMDMGFGVSWLPSYGPEMRSGTSNCHVRISTGPMDSPLVSRPNILLALNEPSLHKFLATVEPGGWVLYNGTEAPAGAFRDDVTFLARPFTRLADGLGDVRVANSVMLGALLAVTGMLSPESIESALQKRVKSERWLELNRRAIGCGQGAAGPGGCK